MAQNTQDSSYFGSSHETLTRFQHKVIPPSPPPSPPRILSISTTFITGGTGFVGKLVIEGLFRRLSEFPLDRLIFLARGKKGQDAQTRFRKTVATSPCFSKLPPGWMNLVQVVEGDVTQPNCGMALESYHDVCRNVTHIIHCAASIKFDNPMKDAAASNIGGALNVCLLAEQCKKLERLLVTSTAYVTPHNGHAITESLPPLPMSVRRLNSIIKEGDMSEAKILELTGHENTYTLSKCMAEHYIFEWSKTLPITIVRPSIISASRKFPFPGWIDSTAAFAGLVIGLSSGMLKVLDGNPSVKLDVVPVDDVAAEILNQTFVPRMNPSRIAYAVSTLTNALDIGETGVTIMNYFAPPTKSARKILFCKHKSLRHRLLNIYHHKVPLFAGKILYSMSRNEDMIYKIGKLTSLITAVNRSFPYFCHNTFDFKPEHDLYGGDNFDTQEYVLLVCQGVQKHILAARAGSPKKEVKKDMLKQAMVLSEKEAEMK